MTESDNGPQEEDDEDEVLEQVIPLARRRQQYATTLINFAVSMLNQIARVEAPPGSTEKLNMRIGIHVGRVVAGVIGTKKLRYDIWGADVLTATHMESSGIPGEVCVSEAVRHYLKGSHLQFEKHTTVEIKTKGRDNKAQTIDSYKLLRESVTLPPVEVNEPPPPLVVSPRLATPPPTTTPPAATSPGAAPPAPVGESAAAPAGIPPAEDV